MKKQIIQYLFVIALVLLSGYGLLTLGRPEQVTLKIIVTDHQKPGIDGVIADFLASPFGAGVNDVEVIASGTRADDQHAYLTSQMVVKSPEFDVIGLDTIWPAEFAENGWIVDLTDLLGTNEMDAYVDGMVTSCTYNDKIWAYPYYMNLGLMFYRKDIITRNGFTIDDFDTWDEFKTNTIEILANTTEQALDPDLVGFIGQFDAYEGGVCNFVEWLGGNGITEMFDTNGDPNLNTSDAREAMEFLKGLIAPRYTGVQGTDYIIPRSALTMDEGSSVGKWLAGEAIFMRQWTFAYSLSAGTTGLNAVDADGNYTQFDVTFLPTMTGAASEKSSCVGGSVLAIPTYSTHQTEAFNLIRFLGDELAQEYALTTLSNFPALKSVYDNLPTGYEWAGEFSDAFDKTLARPVHPKYSQITIEIADKFHDLLTGIKSVPQALGEMEDSITEIIGPEYTSSTSMTTMTTETTISTSESELTETTESEIKETSTEEPTPIGTPGFTVIILIITMCTILALKKVDSKRN